MSEKKNKRPPPLLMDELIADSERMFDSLNDEHPFPCVIVSTAYLEQCLASLLHGFFVRGSTADTICDFDAGVLKDLSSRAKIAYCAGLIDKAVFSNLTLIGAIRNKFAHSHVPITFEATAISELCANLTFPTVGHFVQIDGESGKQTEGGDPWKRYDTTPRSRFMIVVAMLITTLWKLGKNVQPAKSVQTEWAKPAGSR